MTTTVAPLLSNPHPSPSTPFHLYPLSAMSKLQNSSMFRRLDTFAKKLSESTKLPKVSRSSKSTSASASSTSTSAYSADDGHAHVDNEDLDMNLLIGPNKGKTAAQIIDELDVRYFSEGFDPLEEILAAFPAQQTQQSDDQLEAKLNELDVVKLCIDKRLSNQVFANYHHFVDGLSLIGNIKDDLFETSLLCSDGRTRLSAVSRELTLSIFSTLQQSQRMARLTTVQMHLADIAQLLRREKEIALLLKEGEFTAAVNVYKESLGRLAQSGMNKFTCLTGDHRVLTRRGWMSITKIRDDQGMEVLTFNKTSYAMEWKAVTRVVSAPLGFATMSPAPGMQTDEEEAEDEECTSISPTSASSTPLADVTSTPRRSSRPKKEVKYTEDDSDDDADFCGGGDGVSSKDVDDSTEESSSEEDGDEESGDEAKEAVDYRSAAAAFKRTLPAQQQLPVLGQQSQARTSSSVSGQSTASSVGDAGIALYRLQGMWTDIIATSDHRLLLAHIGRGKNPRSDGLAKGKQIVEKSVAEALEELGFRVSTADGADTTVGFSYSNLYHLICCGINTQPAHKIVVPGLEKVSEWWWLRDQQLGFLRFIGFWLGDGFLSVGVGMICIGQKKPEGLLWLDALLDDVFPGWWYKNVKAGTPGSFTYLVRCPPLYEYLRHMAIGPADYNPRDRVSLRNYPHFPVAPGLAAKEQQSSYYQPYGSRGTPGTWTEEEMLAAFFARVEEHHQQRADASSARAQMKAVVDSPPQRMQKCQRVASTAEEEEEALDVVEVADLQDGGVIKIPRSTATQDPAVVAEWEAAGKIVWWTNADPVLPAAVVVAPVIVPPLPPNPVGARISAGTAVVPWNNGWWNLIRGHWFYLKRWLGNQQHIANDYSRLSREQAVALLDGFCRADGKWASVQYQEGTNKPTGQWTCSNSSWPLIDHLQLISQLAGARTTVKRSETRAGKATTIDGREVKFSVDHWVLTFDFTPSKTGVPFQTAMLPQPSPVSDDIAARGYFEYKDDGAVYCITVESDEKGTNSNFLTQRLSLHTVLQKGGKAKRAKGPRTEGDGLNVTAHAVFVGNCLDDLRKRYLRSAESINSRAKEQLQTMCRKFDLTQCSNVVESLISLGETKVLTDLLRKYFPVVIDDLSTSSLLPYLDHERMAADDPSDIKSKRFKELAALLDMSRFGACFLTVLSNFADVMSSCARMEAYLETVVEEKKEGEGVLSSIRAAKDFLSITRADIWTQVQAHVTTLLVSVFLTTQTIDIDDFLRLLHAGFAFITVGETFSRSNSDGLRGQLYKKAKEYVRHFARESFDGVRGALEKEEWKPLKTSRGFVMADLAELRGKVKVLGGVRKKEEEERKEEGERGQVEETKRSPPLDSLEAEDAVAGGIYEAFLRGDNPFRPALQDQLQEYDRRQEEKRMERERGRYYRLQTGTQFKPTSKLLNTRSMQNSLQHASLLTSHTNADIGVILTSSSLVTAKYLGRYISVMEDIKPLAMESFSYLQEVFDLYVYAIFVMFGPKQADFFTDYFDKYLALKKLVQSVKQRVEQGTFGAGIFAHLAIPRTNIAPDVASPQTQSSSSPFSTGSGKDKEKDKTLFGKLGKTLNSNVSQVMGGMTAIAGGNAPKPAAPVHREEKRAHPVLVALCDSVNQEDERRMYAVTERCIAIESIPFLLQVVLANLPRLLKSLKPSEQSTVRAWTTSASAVISDLQSYMYRNLAPVMLPDSVFAPKIRNMDWTIKTPATTASPYVFSILTTLRANTLCMKDNGGLPADVQARLNEEIVSWLEESLVAAYGEVKRCSDEGRGLMRLDAEVMEGALKGLLRMEELKGWDSVRTYVDAYWVKAEEWVQWVRDHRDYSLSVIVTAIQCGAASGMEKKEQKELLLSVSREWQRLAEEEEQRRDEEKAKEREERKE